MKRMKKPLILLLCVVLLALPLGACVSDDSTKGEQISEDPETNYTRALEHLKKGEYEEAHRLFYLIGDYKDAKEYLGKFRIFYQKYTIKSSSGYATLDFQYDDHGNLILADMLALTKNGPVADENALSYKIEYDASGKITKITYRNGEVTVYTYGDDGKLLQHKNYDASGNLTEEQGYPLSEIKQEYDESGNLIKETEYDSQGNVVRTLEYTYDSNQRIVEYRSEEEDVSFSYQFVYNEKGRLKEVCGGLGGFNIEYIYNDAGKLIKSSETYVDTGKLFRTCEYDSNERIVKAIVYTDGGIIANIDEFSYDSAGKLTKHAEYDSEGELTEKNE